MSQLGWVQILYDQQLTSIGYLLSAKIAIETQQFFCPPKPRVVGSIPASRAKSFVFLPIFVGVDESRAKIPNSSEGCPSG